MEKTRLITPLSVLDCVHVCVFSDYVCRNSNSVLLNPLFPLIFTYSFAECHISSAYIKDKLMISSSHKYV